LHSGYCKGTQLFSNLNKIISILVLAAVILAFCGDVAAQYYNDPGLGQKPVASHPQDYKPLGVRAGAFMLHPGVTLGANWTDNAFYANTELRSDTIFHIRPYITAQSTWSRHSLNIRLAADFAIYNKYSARNYQDYFFGISGRVDVRNRSYFSYSADYMNLHEGLDNRTSEQGVTPTRYDYYGGRIGYDHSFSRLSVGGWYARNWLDFDNVVGADGEIIDNQDRDRTTDNYGLRMGYQFMVDKQVFIRYSGYSTKYDQQFDRNGYDRTGSGYRINGGVNFSMTGRLQGDIYASYYNRDFDDPRLPSTNGWLLGGGAGLQWNPSDLTSVYARIQSGIQETTDANSTSFVQQIFSIRVDHELTRDIQLNAFVSYGTNDYNLIDTTVENPRTKDKLTRAGVGANWFINRHTFLNASYAYSSFNSSVPNDDYTSNDIWLLLGLEY
jgi:hypothetical protein